MSDQYRSGLEPHLPALSPTKGIAIAGLALVVGLLVTWQGFGQSTDDAAATIPSILADKGASTTVQASEEEPSERIAPPEILPRGDAESTTTTVATKQVDAVFLVINSGAPKGAAAALTAELDDAGYSTVPPSNTERVTDAGVYFVEGWAESAESVAAQLTGVAVIALDPSQAPVEDLRGAGVIIVIDDRLSLKF